MAVVFGRLGESALEGTDEAGMVFVSNGMSDFFDREVTCGEKLRGLVQPALNHQAAQLRSGLLLKQPLEMRRG